MSFRPRAMSGLKLAGVAVTVAVIAGCGAAYYTFVTHQQEYLTGRNFRLLASLGTQIENTAYAEARVIGSLAGRQEDCRPGTPAALADRWRRLRESRDSTAVQDEVTFFRVACLDSPRASYELTRSAGVRLVVQVAGTPRGPAATRDGDAGGDPAYAAVKLTGVLEPIFESRRRQGAFETIALVDGTGAAAYGRGALAGDLATGGLAGWLGSKPGGPSAKDAVGSATVIDVSIAGVPYKLFIQPCCAGSQGEARWALVGLVTAENLRAASLAISTSVVKFVMLALLLAVLGWPFLKLTLHGDREKVRVFDVVQVLAASVAGLAVVTITLLDTAAYTALNRDTDAQLRRLASTLDRHVVGELGLAFTQMVCAEKHLGVEKHSATSPAAVDHALAGHALCDSPEADGAVRPASGRSMPGEARWPYPYFETIAFIDASGQQQMKFAGGRLTPPINVSGRSYFSGIVQGLGWTQPPICGNRQCVLESVWSWTTGEPLAVLSTAVQSTEGRPAPPWAKVVAIAMPMRSLIRPVLPPGFEFAVIDHSGQVLFHSDRFRNTNENFFIEADNDRRLRAKVAAHSEEALELRYFGAAYRAYVEPLSVPDLHIVTLAQRQRLWAINRDWLVAALIFTAIPFVLWLLFAIKTLVPRSAWAWPDPLRQAQYGRVAAFALGLAAIAALAAGSPRVDVKFAVALTLPTIGWFGSYLLLVRRPASSGEAGEVPPMPSHRRYLLAAVPLLLVTGAVPGALMFLASYQLHTAAFVKNGQLLLVQSLQERARRLEKTFGPRAVSSPAAPSVTTASFTAASRPAVWGGLGCFEDVDLDVGDPYDTTIARASGETPVEPASVPTACVSAASGPGSTRQDTGTGDTGSTDGEIILAFLEDYLPYYSEASVEWRELLHDAADDGTWTSRVIAGSRIETTLLSAGVTLSTATPRIGRRLGPEPSDGTVTPSNPPAPAGPEPGSVATSGEAAGVPVIPPRPMAWPWVLWLGVAGFGVTLLAGGIVKVFCQRVFLVDLGEPLWLRAPLAQGGAENVFVICDAAAKAGLDQCPTIQLAPFASRPDSEPAWAQLRRDLDRRSKAGGALVVDDFEDGLDDGDAMLTKLRLLEELVADPDWTVIVVSALTPRALSEAFRQVRALPARRRGGPVPTAGGPGPVERWSALMAGLTLVDRRAVPEAAALEASWPRSSRALLDAERASHPYVARVCDDLVRAAGGDPSLLTREQLLDEIGERTARFYRRLWTSCTDDEKVVLGHIADHGFANIHVRRVVRRLLGRGLLRKDPALRPMSESFRQFVRSAECSTEVTRLETQAGRSAWDRLRWPLALGVVGAGLFLFVTQKELYNAIFGVTTAAGVSIPALIRAVGMLAGRRELEGERA